MVDSNAMEAPTLEPSGSASPSLPETDKGRAAYMALLGCCILQLPVWGFSVSYGVVQEYYLSSLDFNDGNNSTGVIGTTANGILYISMPFLFALFANRFANFRRIASVIGTLIAAISFVLSSFATATWQLVITQGVLQALGCTLLYSSTTIFVDEWFVRRKGFAYGVILSVKSAVATFMPIFYSLLLSKLGFRNSFRIWGAIVFATGMPCAFLLRPRLNTANNNNRGRRSRSLSWKFLSHPTFYVYQISNILFSAGYCLPYTYLPSFARSVLNLPTPVSSLMLALLSAPSIVASFTFGVLSDGVSIYHGRSLSVSTVTILSAFGACLPVFLFWGFASDPGRTGTALLILFSIFYGFFAGGYSATWGGIVKEVKHEGDRYDDSVDTGLIFGLLNAGRGVGYIVGGFVGVELLKAGQVEADGGWAYGSKFGSVILFTGIGAALGGWNILWNFGKYLRR